MSCPVGRWQRPVARGALAIVVALVGCGTSAVAPVAELVEGQGTVEREHAGAWAAAPHGQPFVVGDAVRTGSAAWARLRVRGGGVVRMGADTLLRFAAGGARLEVGEAEAEELAFTIETEAGPAQVEPGGRLRAERGPGGLRFQVTVGRAVIMGVDGPIPLGGGQGLVVAIGGAIIERIEPVAPGPAPPPIVDAAPPPAAVTTATAHVKGKGVTARVGTGPWRTLPAGPATLAPGETVKLPRGATLELARGADRATVTGPAELDLGTADGPVATARSGTVRVVARGGELALAVPGGVIVTRGGEAAVAITRAVARVRVERGEAGLTGRRGEAVVRVGETGLVKADGSVEVRDPVPTTTDVELALGESATIHDPSRRVAVKVGFGTACAGEGALELADARGSFGDPRRFGGGGVAAFFVGASGVRYRLRCTDGKTAKQGSIAVRGDTGAAPIVKDAARSKINQVDLDGRNYSIGYQNRLPAVTVRWSGAPSSGGVLHVASARGERTFAGGASVELAAGEIAEGRHEMWMTGGARTSPRTVVRIAFDNAAPTAQIWSPAPGAVWGDSVAVAGVTVEGWTVAVDGVAVPTDAAGRFRVNLEVVGKREFAIRLAHPQHGVHYYVRRRK